MDPLGPAFIPASWLGNHRNPKPREWETRRRGEILIILSTRAIILSSRKDNPIPFTSRILFGSHQLVRHSKLKIMMINNEL
jgi:hypothetical protein